MLSRLVSRHLPSATPTKRTESSTRKLSSTLEALVALQTGAPALPYRQRRYEYSYRHGRNNDAVLPYQYDYTHGILSDSVLFSLAFCLTSTRTRRTSHLLFHTRTVRVPYRTRTWEHAAGQPAPAPPGPPGAPAASADERQAQMNSQQRHITPAQPAGEISNLLDLNKILVPVLVLVRVPPYPWPTREPCWPALVDYE